MCKLEDQQCVCVCDTISQFVRLVFDNVDGTRRQNFFLSIRSSLESNGDAEDFLIIRFFFFLHCCYSRTLLRTDIRMKYRIRYNCGVKKKQS